MKTLGLFTNLDQQAEAVFYSVLSLQRTQKIILGIAGLGILAAAIIAVPEMVYLGVGLPVLLLIWHRPEFGLLAIIFLTSSFIPADVVDLRLPIGGGLDLRDLALIGMLGLLIFRGLARKELAIPWWPVGGPLLLFLGFAIFSGIYALFFQNVETNWALGELRILLFYAVFLVTGWSITRRRQLVKVLAGLFLIADLVAGVIILQQFLGRNNPLLTAMSGTHWHLWQQDAGAGGIGTLRIVPPGHVLMYFMMVMAFCLMVFSPKKRRLRVVLALQFLFLNFGLLLTYTRAQWMASALALGLIAIIYIPTYKAQLPRYLFVGIAIFFLVLFVYGLYGTRFLDSINTVPIINSLVARAGSDTLPWRLFETEEALRSISEHPILGVGLGNSYRDLTLMAGEASGWWAGGLAAGELSRFTRYIHNSYLAIAVKMGLPALITFLWFCAAFLVSGWQLYRNLNDRLLKGLVLAAVTGFLGLLAWSTLHSHFIETESTSVVGLIIGLLASVHYMERRQSRSYPIQGRPPSRVANGELSQ